jgi:hypothetical protein
MMFELSCSLHIWILFGFPWRYDFRHSKRWKYSKIHSIYETLDDICTKEISHRSLQERVKLKKQQFQRFIQCTKHKSN